MCSGGHPQPGGGVHGSDAGGAGAAQQQQPRGGVSSGAAADAAAVATLLPTQHHANAVHQGGVAVPGFLGPRGARHGDLHSGLLHCM